MFQEVIIKTETTEEREKREEEREKREEDREKREEEKEMDIQKLGTQDFSSI